MHLCTLLVIYLQVLDQNVPKDKMLSFQFRVKFFPEDLGDELVQEFTQHLFYLQVKASIVNEEVYCSPEAAVLLASYAIQAEVSYSSFTIITLCKHTHILFCSTVILTQIYIILDFLLRKKYCPNE